MKRVRRTFTMTETVERMLVVSKVNPTGEDCPSCAPGTGWLTLDEAVRIAGAEADADSAPELPPAQTPAARGRSAAGSAAVHEA